jgi:hypothetical protein
VRGVHEAVEDGICDGEKPHEKSAKRGKLDTDIAE